MTASATRGTLSVEVSRMGGLDLTEFLRLSRAGQLAEGVADMHGTRDLPLEQVAGVRQHRGHPRADVVAVDERGVTDRYPVDVGDRVQSPGGNTPTMTPRLRARSP